MSTRSKVEGFIRDEISLFDGWVEEAKGRGKGSNSSCKYVSLQARTAKKLLEASRRTDKTSVGADTALVGALKAIAAGRMHFSKCMDVKEKKR